MKKDKEWLKEEVNAQNIILDKGYIYTEDILKLINQLEEPKQEIVTVPQFVADYIEYNKQNKQTLWEAGENSFEYSEEISKWLFDWTGNEAVERFDLFSRAWLAYPNIQVEKEKLYRVKVGNLYMLEDTLRHTLVEDKAHIFTSKSRADAVAAEVGGTVEEVTE